MPDELYIDSFKEGKEILLTYDGPEHVNVLVDKVYNMISGLNPETFDQDSFNLIEVDAEEFPEIAYFLLNSSDSHEYEYEDEIMENGDIYKKVLNPTIHDAYCIVYDSENELFKLDLIVKTIEENFVNLNLAYIKNKLNFVLSNEEGKKEKNEDLDVSEELLSEVSKVVEDIDTYIQSNKTFMSWKYTNFDNVIDVLLPISDQIKDLVKNYQ
jgi:hypothetical protein